METKTSTFSFTLKDGGLNKTLYGFRSLIHVSSCCEGSGLKAGVWAVSVTPCWIQSSSKTTIGKTIQTIKSKIYKNKLKRLYSLSSFRGRAENFVKLLICSGLTNREILHLLADRHHIIVVTRNCARSKEEPDGLGGQIAGMESVHGPVCLISA